MKPARVLAPPAALVSMISARGAPRFLKHPRFPVFAATAPHAFRYPIPLNPLRAVLGPSSKVSFRAQGMPLAWPQSRDDGRKCLRPAKLRFPRSPTKARTRGHRALGVGGDSESRRAAPLANLPRARLPGPRVSMQRMCTSPWRRKTVRNHAESNPVDLNRRRR